MQIKRMSGMVSLLACLAVDFMGFLSFLIPFIGEVTDVFTAGLQAVFLQYMFGNVYITGIGMIEELAPGLDFIPTCTISWFLYKFGVLK